MRVSPILGRSIVDLQKRVPEMTGFTPMADVESTEIFGVMRTMTCERCIRGEEATYRACSDLIDMAVCAACADEARMLGIAIHPLTKRSKRESYVRSN